MDAARALSDLAEVSSQIEGAVLAEASGAVLASTYADDRGEAIASAALSLLREAEESTGAGSRAALTQVVASLASGAVFVVRSGERLVAAVTSAEPTAGLVLYDLKTCLRLAEEAPRPKRRRAASNGATQRGKTAAAGRKNTRKKKDSDA